MPGGYRHILDNPEHRRKAQRVFVDKATNDVILRLHETDIVRVKPNGDVILSTGGWATHKTINGMNDALVLFDMYVDSADNNPPRGNWRVYDVDGTVITYINNKVNYIMTIPAKGDDADNRCRWLAEAFNVPYDPAAKAPVQPRVVSAPPRPAGMQPAPAAVAAVPVAPQPVPVAVAVPVAVHRASSSVPPPRQQGPSGSWAHVAAAGSHAPARQPAGEGWCYSPQQRQLSPYAGHCSTSCSRTGPMALHGTGTCVVVLWQLVSGFSPGCLHYVQIALITFTTAFVVNMPTFKVLGMMVLMVLHGIPTFSHHLYLVLRC